MTLIAADRDVAGEAGRGAAGRCWVCAGLGLRLGLGGRLALSPGRLGRAAAAGRGRNRCGREDVQPLDEDLGVLAVDVVDEAEDRMLAALRAQVHGEVEDHSRCERIGLGIGVRALLGLPAARGSHVDFRHVFEFGGDALEARLLPRVADLRAELHRRPGRAGDAGLRVEVVADPGVHVRLRRRHAGHPELGARGVGDVGQRLAVQTVGGAGLQRVGDLVGQQAHSTRRLRRVFTTAEVDVRA